jgi:spore maturation protein CgeB
MRTIHTVEARDVLRSGLQRQERPRICVATSRKLTTRVFQCGTYEAQDVLCATEDAELVSPQRGSSFEKKQDLHHRLLYWDITKRLVFRSPGVQKVSLEGDYDLFVAFCQNYWDMLYLNAIQGWEKKCRQSVCWIDELWASELPQYKYWIHSLNRFDHIFVSARGTVEPLSKLLGRSVHWMPGGVDTLRFSPYPTPPARSLDVYSMGRRYEDIHKVLVRLASDRKIFYLYDTLPVWNVMAYDYSQHRSMLANVAKRSRYFMVAPGKMNFYEQTKGQVEMGVRYFEGAAAGTVMLGQAPDSEAFRELFPWSDAVIPVKPDGSDIEDVMKQLDACPTTLAAMSSRNATEALLRFDWVYRWKDIMRIAGIPPSAGMAAREVRLKQLAALATNSVQEPAMMRRVQ